MNARQETFAASCLLLSLSTVFHVTPAAAETRGVAIGKDAEQSGTYRGGREARRAVDGVTDAGQDEANCAMVDTADPSYVGRRDFAWWQVDLEDPYTINSVTIYSDAWSTLTNFDVYVSNVPGVTDAASRYLCLSVSSVAIAYLNSNETSSFLLNCTQPRVGRYVTVARTGGNTPTKMTLCEVEIDGGRYYYCDNCGNGSTCNSTTGCSLCRPGYVPPSCTSGCSLGYYGTNCGQRCPPCPDPRFTCDSFTGECPDYTEPNNGQPNQENPQPTSENTFSSRPASSGLSTKSQIVALAVSFASLVLLHSVIFS